VIEDENTCLEKKISKFLLKVSSFPTGDQLSQKTREILQRCSKNILKQSCDDALLSYYQTEYRIYQCVERQICQPEIARVFKDIDDFLKTASSIMNRRKARAGRSLENHVDHILNDFKLQHKMQPKIDGNPDIIIPHEEAYYDSKYPKNKLFIIGVKTTCKDRWR